MNVQCGICKDAIDVLTKSGDGGSVASALPCGHVFHSPCINQWLNQSGSTIKGSCPHCRSCVAKKQVLKLFLDLVPLENYEEDPVVIKAVNENLKRDIESLKDQLAHKGQTTDKLTAINISLRERVLELENSLSKAQSKERLLTLAQAKLNSRTKELENERDENKKLKNKLMSLQAASTIISGSLADVEDALPVLEKNDLASLVYAYKKDVVALNKKNALLFNDLSRAQQETRKLEKSLKQLNNEHSMLARVVEMYKSKQVDPSQQKHLGQQHLAQSESPASDSAVETVDLTSPSGLQITRESTPKVVTPRISRLKDFKIPRIPRRVDPTESPVAFSYDGLGGHSRVDDFPQSRLAKRPKIVLGNRIHKA